MGSDTTTMMFSGTKDLHYEIERLQKELREREQTDLMKELSTIKKGIADVAEKVDGQGKSIQTMYSSFPISKKKNLLTASLVL